MTAIMQSIDGCDDGDMAFDIAYARILSLVTEKLPVEQVSLTDCVGRIAAAQVYAMSDLPRFDQAAMDGYAVNSVLLATGARLPVTGRAAAGDVPTKLSNGTAHRILTGAGVPEGADAVIAQESVTRSGDVIRLDAIVAPGTNIRLRGEDIQSGQVLVQAGTMLDFRHIAVLAAQGIARVAVRRRPRVAIISSGLELRCTGDVLQPGQIYDSNAPMLAALLASWGAELVLIPPVPDNAAAMRHALADAAFRSDLVLTTAGISVGDEDHVREALLDLDGDLAVLKIAMKPGKPLAAGRLGSALFVGLPGNPMAALTGAVVFIQPMLKRMLGVAPLPPMRAMAAFDLHRNAGRTEFLPVQLNQSTHGPWAERAGPDGSGRLAPLLRASGFAVLNAEVHAVQRGTSLQIIPFTSHRAGIDGLCIF